MTALVTCDGNTMCIFFNSTFHYFSHRTVMTEVNDLSSFALQYAAHNIDGRIMPVKQAGSSNYPDPFF